MYSVPSSNFFGVLKKTVSSFFSTSQMLRFSKRWFCYLTTNPLESQQGVLSRRNRQKSCLGFLVTRFLMFDQIQFGFPRDCNFSYQLCYACMFMHILSQLLGKNLRLNLTFGTSVDVYFY